MQDNYQTLLLTSAYMPHKIVHYQTAITMFFLDKIEVLEEYEEVIRSPSLAMRIPAVARIKRHMSAIKKGMKFSKVNVLQRDGFRCQYCGQKKNFDELNYDHVIPRAQGGQTTWTNIVTACAGPKGCNARKGARTPEQAGMRLLSVPVKPKTLPLAVPVFRSIRPEWENWVTL